MTVLADYNPDQPGKLKTAVVCPANVKSNWLRHFEQFAPEDGGGPDVFKFSGKTTKFRKTDKLTAKSGSPH